MLLLLLATGALAFTGSGARATDVRVTVLADSVTIEGGRVSAQEVVEALSKAVGAELRGTVAREGTVDLPLRADSVESSLTRLLGGQSFSVRYAGGRPSLIEIFATAEPSAPAVTPSARAGGERVPASEKTDADAKSPRHDSTDSTPPLRVTRRLAHALGDKEPTFEEVRRAMVHETDVRLRGDALRAVVTSLEDQPEFAAAFLRMLDTLDDAELAEKLQEIAGHRARIVSRQIARATNVPVVRDRFRSVESLLATD